MTLASAISAAKLTPTAALNLLQEAGIVSDNCIDLADVAAQDQPRAVAWLQGLRMQQKWQEERKKIETKGTQ